MPERMSAYCSGDTDHLASPQAPRRLNTRLACLVFISCCAQGSVFGDLMALAVASVKTLQRAAEYRDQKIV